MDVTCCNPLTSIPNTNPYIAPHYQQPAQQMLPGSWGFGMDPNPAFTAAINRLAAAIEKLAEKSGDGGTEI